MNRDLVKGIVLGVIVIGLLFAASVALAAPWQHEQSWTEAVHLGTIDGDPAYYYDGLAAADEYYHALITATNQIAADQWVQPSPQGDESVPGTYCEHQLWEYRSEPGEGYWPQLFADTWVYDSITVFDDFYGPVTYLDPIASRMYEHPAGGYDRLIVCMGPLR